MKHFHEGHDGKTLMKFLFVHDRILGIYAKRFPVCHQDMPKLKSPARMPILHDFDKALGAPIVFFFNLFLLNKSGPGPTLL